MIFVLIRPSKQVLPVRKQYWNIEIEMMHRLQGHFQLRIRSANCRSGCCCFCSAQIYVIAANGIETPRLLLMSRNQIANGIANSSGMVGRNLMDHPQYLTWGLQPYISLPRPPRYVSHRRLCDGAFRSHRAAFRNSLGNEAWSAVVGGVGGDPQVTTLDLSMG